MNIDGLVFAGSSTGQAAAMSVFVSDVLGLDQVEVPDSDASFFAVPDGSMFAVASSDGMGSARTVGFRVTDLEAAWSELRDLGIEVDDEINENERYRYVHFVAPDGHVYELVEER
jgi:catechol 2,3-dioxygenase-like lactoylglutathione lyase family enzyme